MQFRLVVQSNFMPNDRRSMKEEGESMKYEGESMKCEVQLSAHINQQHISVPSVRPVRANEV